MGRKKKNETEAFVADLHDIMDGAGTMKDTEIAEAFVAKGWCKRSEGEWISVEEKNPEDVYGKDREKITVLVCTKSGKVSASTRCARYSYDHGQNTWVRTGEYEWSGSKKVTHWQPMPDPPHQQDDRQERIET